MKTLTRVGPFVALLRGVNVGGKNMISMRSLKESFETIGFTDVSTYINSGNIIFNAKEDDPRMLEQKIERMLAKEYQLNSKVVVRTFAEIAKLVKSLPRNWEGNSDWRYNVIFLRHTVDAKGILAELPAKPDIEEIVYRPGAVLWSVHADAAARTNFVKLPGQKIYQDMTIRNLNTTKKLYEIMKKVSGG